MEVHCPPPPFLFQSNVHHVKIVQYAVTITSAVWMFAFPITLSRVSPIKASLSGKSSSESAGARAVMSLCIPGG